jgi:hypothetical protein
LPDLLSKQEAAAVTPLEQAAAALQTIQFKQAPAEKKIMSKYLFKLFYIIILLKFA